MTQDNLKSVEQDNLVCTICEGPFNLENEGGDLGFIGMLSVAFCPTCKAGIFDYVESQCHRCESLFG